MKQIFLIASAILTSTSLFAALTEAQRVQDFQALSAVYAKSYGPANWKIQALGVNIFETADWVKRVRAAKNDLEHVSILMEYAASFQDTHTSVSMQSNFYADLGFYCDLYDGKVLIDVIDRFLLPSSRYPIAAGDELVSIDGRPALEVARELAKEQGWGNPRAALRAAIDNITFRTQSAHPLAVNLPEASTVEIRKQNGTLETYRIQWDKVGYPIRNLGASASPNAISKGLEIGPMADPTLDGYADLVSEKRSLHYSSRLARVQQSRVRAAKTKVRGEDGVWNDFQSIRGFGATSPVFTMPTGFVQRLGRNSTDFLFTGTYVSDGLRIGYLRLRDFDFSSNAQRNQLANEIAFFNSNTDGLVVDVMRNPGGFTCATVDALAMLVPDKIVVDGESVRPSLPWISYFDSILLDAEFFGDPQYVIDTWQFQLDLVTAAYGNGRGLTGSIPSCALDFEDTSFSFAYRKPLIVLIDDFSTSAADSFPAMMQDNKRGKLVGMRSNGAGATVYQLDAGPWSESSTNLAISIVMRSETRKYDGFPESRFIENVGVRPDIELDYMTTENLLNSGRPFVSAFTRIIVDEIRAARP